MEVAVNNRLRKVGSYSEEEYFRDKFKKFANLVKSKGVQVSQLDVFMQDPFWKLRNNIVHDGYFPHVR